MKLKNVLIVVKDIEKSKCFYHDMFGLNVVLDNDGNIILTEGLVLQEEKYWKEFALVAQVKALIVIFLKSLLLLSVN